MTKERARELIPIIQAWVEGKKVEICEPEGIYKKWEVYKGTCPDFNNENWKWRIKPEPREFWIEIKTNGSHLVYNSFPSTTSQTHSIIHVREVME